MDIKKERDQQSSKSITQQKHVIKTNDTLLARVREVNSYDMKLYHLGKRFIQSDMTLRLTYYPPSGTTDLAIPINFDKFSTYTLSLFSPFVILIYGITINFQFLCILRFCWKV